MRIRVSGLFIVHWLNGIKPQRSASMRRKNAINAQDDPDAEAQAMSLLEVRHQSNSGGLPRRPATIAFWRKPQGAGVRAYSAD